MKQSANSYTFAGFPSPNTTATPDILYDELLPVLSGAELKVVLYIIRHTYGYGKRSDDISLSQICHGITRRDGKVVDRGTGLAKSTAVTAIKGLIQLGIIVAKRNRSTQKGDEATTYALKFTSRLPYETTPVSENHTGGRTKIKQVRVRKSNPQETTKQQTTIISKSKEADGGEGEKRIGATSISEMLKHYQHPSQDVSVALRAAEEPQRGSKGIPQKTSLLDSLAPRKLSARGKAFLRELSAEFHDSHHLLQNIKQVENLMTSKQMEEEAMMQFLYTARGLTREIETQRPAAYFFTVLRERLGLGTPRL